MAPTLRRKQLPLCRESFPGSLFFMLVVCCVKQRLACLFFCSDCLSSVNFPLNKHVLCKVVNGFSGQIINFCFIFVFLVMGTFDKMSACRDCASRFEIGEYSFS
jgi:hypothetical protein